MASSMGRCFYLFLSFALIAGLASSSFISDDVLVSHGHTGRNLLQAQSACSIDFEHQNYTIITSECKGPNYQVASCCPAFKRFACPFASQINDMTSNCASTMFSYINLYGKYPPALFSSLCKEGAKGLDCNSTDVTSAKNSKEKSGAQKPKVEYPMVMMMLAGGFFFMMLLDLF